MNRISEIKRLQASQIFLTGESTRYVASVVGIDKNTAWTIQKQTWASRGIITCACGQKAGHRGWCNDRIARSPGRLSYILSQLRPINSFDIYIPTRPRYERPDIPNERETELPILVRNPGVICLDAPDLIGISPYEKFASAALQPDELLNAQRGNGVDGVEAEAI